MPTYINGSLVGMGDAVKDAEYQKKLSEKTQEFLGDRTSISVAELKKSSLFAKVYKKLDAEGKKNFDAILNLDGDSKNVSEKELKTLMTLLDANLDKVPLEDREAFFMDGEFSIGKNSGIYQATAEEIQNVYKNTKTRAEQKAEEMAKLKAKAQKLDEIGKLIADYDISKGSDLTKALTTIDANISAGNKDGYELYNVAISKLFNGQLVNTNVYRDGGSREYTLKDGTKIFHDNRIFGEENGFVTITRPDGSVEKYNPEGEKVQ